MIDSKKLTNTVSAFIEKNLLGNAPFQSTSGFISYITNKESKKKFNDDSKTFE
jgi:hypothetical protein